MDNSVSKYVKSVLLIDDDPSCNFILGEFIGLVSTKIERYSTFSVDESFKIMGESNSFPEVIFVDLNMPVKSGFDFLEVYQSEYFSQHPKTKIYVLTSSLRPTDKEKTLSFSCVTDYMSKSEIDGFIESALLLNELQ